MGGSSDVEALLLVLKRIEWSGEATAAVGKHGARKLVDRHDWCGTKEAAELQDVSLVVADSRDNADRRGLGVDDTNGHLICDDACDGLYGRIARNCNHVQANGAD